MDEDINELKKELIQTELGIENLDLDNLSDEELDDMTQKVVASEGDTEEESIIEKIFNIIDNNKDKEVKYIVEKIAKDLEMNLREAQEIYEELKEL